MVGKVMNIKHKNSPTPPSRQMDWRCCMSMLMIVLEVDCYYRSVDLCRLSSLSYASAHQIIRPAETCRELSCGPVLVRLARNKLSLSLISQQRIGQTFHPFNGTPKCSQE